MMPNTNSTKSSKTRHSMPVFPNQGMNFGQGQYNPNQFGYQNMNQMYNPTSENLFSIEETPQPYHIIPNQQKGTHRPLSNIYQPNMYMNPNIPQSSDQAKQPYNFSAQINLSKKKADEDKENFKQVSYMPLKNNQNDGQEQRGSLGGRSKGEENLQEITKKHEELINLILTEEEEVISSHRQHIDDMVDLIKQVIIIL